MLSEIWMCFIESHTNTVKLSVSLYTNNKAWIMSLYPASLMSVRLNAQEYYTYYILYTVCFSILLKRPEDLWREKRECDVWSYELCCLRRRSVWCCPVRSSLLVWMPASPDTDSWHIGTHHQGNTATNKWTIVYIHFSAMSQYHYHNETGQCGGWCRCWKLILG